MTSSPRQAEAARDGAYPPVGEPRGRPRSRRSPAGRLLRLIAWCAAAGATVLAVWCATLFFVSLSYEDHPSVGRMKHADVGIVLGAKLWDDKPSPGLRERLDHALALYKADKFDRFLLSGGLDAGGAKLTEAEGMRDYLIGQGVPPEDIVLEPNSHSTYENLQFSRDIMRENGWNVALIVTHQFHGSRAGDIAGTLGYDPVQVSVVDSRVLNMAYNRTREVLACTKWLAEKWLLHAG
ncbi:YdcF family protein [Cohnella xylanilytica]|uniref:YdcF family protein n=1 Tax=Cohnella xylanilytica TaxID=557555 RepID=A0A841TYE0_9BACL|nr:YdcF family protein [Cohnella xylanilytica]MBB6691163.1 YdcF family protein [Cohnella xylanilytica]